MLSKRLKTMHQAGSSLIEILVTIVILAFGLLGLAGFLMQVQTTEWESYQRAQALNLLNDMVERININKAVALTYVTTSPMGTGDTGLADCSTLAIGAPRDLCDWSNKLKGSAEVKAGANIGAMEGARGCITQVQAANPAAGLCQPGIYQVSVAWQGRNNTVAPNTSLACGKDEYGDDKARRVIAQAVSVALLACN